MKVHAKLIDKDHGWKRLFQLADALKGKSYTKVGVLADDAKGGLHQTDPTTGKSSKLTLAEIAAVLHFGTTDGRIPARPFLTMTFDRGVDEMVKFAAKLLGAILDGKMGVEQALKAMGMKFAFMTQATITQGSEVPPTNRPSTKARKEALTRKGAIHSTRTLVMFGDMVKAITHVVVMGRKASGGAQGRESIGTEDKGE